MAELTRNAARTSQAAIAALVLAAALVAGIVGGLVGARLANGIQTAQVAPKGASIDWVQYGQNWERQYRAMYPVTVDAKLAEYGANWQWEYERQHPPR